MKMRPFLLTLILLAGTNTSLMGAAACCKCIPIKQKCKNNIATPSVFKITNSGNYALTGDFKGEIVIAASDVTLDLCSFKVTGPDAITVAISAKGNNITIKNGSVTNSNGLGIEISGSTGSLIENVDVFGCNRAVALLGCKSSQVNFLNAYQNINTSNAVILVRGSESIQLNNVQANQNTKTLIASIENANPGIGIISIFDSFNVTLTNCSANFNTRSNDQSLFAPLAALFSKSVTFANCQANDNSIVIKEDTKGFAPIHLQGCIDTIIDGSQANRNHLIATKAFLRPIFSLGSSRTIIKNSQINDNHAIGLIPSSITNANQDLSGIMIFGLSSSPALESSDLVISQCQVSGNAVDNGGSNRNASFALLNGVYILGNSDSTGNGNFKNRSLIEYCQVNDNIMKTTGLNQIVAGINITASEDVTVANCSTSGHFGGNSVLGIAATSGPNAFLGINTGSIGSCRNIKIINSTANDNNNLPGDFSIGITFAGSPNAPILNSEIVDCQANGNSSGASCSGIGLSNVQSCTIMGCQTDSNGSIGSGLGEGISTSSFNSLTTNKDCSIINCSAKNNQDAGFNLNGQNNNFLLKDNIAIGNAGFGFEDVSAVPLTSRYLGNYADNGTGINFVFSNFPFNPPIQIFTLDSTGTYTHATGDPGHFSALTNVQAQ